MLLKKKEEIENWLNQYNIKNYKLIEDQEYGYIVNVNDHVNLYGNNLISIDVKFNEIKGNFDCSVNLLRSLKGSPKIVNGNFFCYVNELTNLKGGPEKVTGYFDCSENYLKTLEGAPKIIQLSFDCNFNQLKTLEYFPQVLKSISCSCNKLTSLKGIPKVINGSFDCSNNLLETLENCPEIIGKTLNFSKNKLTINSLKNLPKKVGENNININKNNLNGLENINKFNELK